MRVCPTGKRQAFFLSSDGNKFDCARSALEHMAQLNYPVEDIEVMSQHSLLTTLPFGKVSCGLPIQDIYLL